MAKYSLVLLVALVAGAFAGPLSSGSLPKCSKECSASPLQKFLFKPHTTYQYKYEGKSLVKLEGVPDGKTELQWEADVDLMFITPCDVAVQIRSQKFQGESETLPFERQLTQYPLVVAMSDGVVTSVCAHPEDTPVSLNLKKGIVSNIQNTLPSLSKIHSGKTFVETDIAGRCPTLYVVEERSPKSVEIIKRKEHKSCEERFGNQNQSPLSSLLMKSPLPLQSSNSTCVQKIENGIVMETRCMDINIVKPYPGSYKFIEAVQESKLTFQRSKSGVNVQPMQSIRRTKLTSEFVLEPKTQEVVPEVESMLRELCSKVENKLEEDAARILAKTIGLLYRVPEKQVQQILGNIKSGSYCSKSKKLENIFLDAIAFTNNAGSVEIMVQELLRQDFIGGRTPLYTIALHLMKRPCLKTIKALEPLFSEQRTPAPVLLAAGTLVGKYFKEHQKSQQEEPIRQIMSVLSRRVESTCRSSKRSEEQKIEALTVLKTIGNIANMTKQLEKEILECAQSPEASIPVRVAAAQSFRKCNCTSEMAQSLTRQTLRNEEPTEVRIASYLAAIRCADLQQAREIVERLSEEPSSQVRSFILSHLRNYQSSSAPFLQDQRYNLTAFAIPSDYEWDVRRYSRNIDMSYYMDTIGLGAGVDTNVVYVPNSYLPRQMQTNITLDLFRNVINIGEFGIRVEDLESLVEMFVGPEGYLQNTPVERIMEDLARLVREKGQNIKQHIENGMGAQNRLQMPSLKQISQWFQGNSEGSRKPTIDAFYRIFGKEILFVSGQVGQLSESSMDRIIEKVMSVVTNLVVEILNKDIETARALQFNNEYFVPTIQGIPLQLKYVTTAIASISAKTQSDIMQSKLMVSPGLSIHMNGFIGYNLGAKSGLRHNATIYSAPELELEVDVTSSQAVIKFDLPKKNELIKVKSDVYMMTKLPGQADKKMAPTSSYPTFKKDQCSATIKKILGVQVCYEVEVPKLTETEILPLGMAKFSLSAEKTSQQPLLRTMLKWNASPEEKSVKIDVLAPGASVQEKLVTEMIFKSAGQRKSGVVFVKVPDYQIQEAIKMEIESASSQSGKKYELNIYAAPRPQFSSSDKILEVLIGGGYESETVSGKFTLKTMRPLTKFVAADIQVDASVKLSPSMKFIPKSLNLRKFEYHLELLQKLKTSNYIRRSVQAEEATYQIKSKTSLGEKTLLEVQGQGKVQGHVEEKNLDSQLQLQVQLPMGSYETMAEFVLSERQQKTLLLIKKSSGQKVFHMESQVLKKSQEYMTVNAELEVPQYMPKYSVQGQVKTEQSDSYRINFVAKRNEQPIYEIEGPLKVSMMEGEYREQSQLVVKCMRSSRQAEFITRVVYSPEEMEYLLQVKSQSQQLFKIQGAYLKKGESQFSSSSALMIPKLIDSRISLEKRESLVELTMNSMVLPSSQHSRRVKTHMAIDTEQKKITATVATDAERNPGKVVSIDAQYEFSLRQKLAQLKGEATYNQKTYRYKLETILDMLQERPQQQSRNVLKIELTKPSQEKFEFEISQQVQKEGRDTATIQFLSKLKTFRREVYRVESKHTVEYSRYPLKFAIKGRTQVKVPQIPELQREVVVEVNSWFDERQKDAKLSIKVAGPALRKPVIVEAEIAYPMNNIKYNLVLDLGQVMDLKVKSNVEVRMESERSEIRSALVKVELKLPQTEKYTLKAETTESKPIEFVLAKGEKKILGLNYASVRRGEWIVRITVPSRQMELHSKSNEEEMAISYYPNAERRDQRYEAGVSHSVRSHLTSRGQSINTIMRLRHPERQSEMRISSALELLEEKSQGRLELDIFENSSDKMTVDIKIFQLKPATYEVHAEFQAPKLSMKPKLVSVISYTRDVKRFDLTLLKNQGEQSPALDISLSMMKTTPLNSNLYALLKTPSQKYEATAVIQPQRMFSCRGKSMNGTLHGTNLGSIDFVTAVCAPAYIEFGVKPSQNHEMFITKIGMMNPANIKFAIDQVWNSSTPISSRNAATFENTLSLYGRPAYLPKQPVVLFGAKLWTPMMVTIGTKYNTTSMQQYAKSAEKAMMKVSEIIEELSRVPREVSQAILGESNLRLNPELRSLHKELTKQVEEFVNEVKDVLPSRESVEELREKVVQAYRKIEEQLKKVQEQSEQIVRDTTGMSTQEIQEKIQKVEKMVSEMINKYKREIKQLVKKIEMEGLQVLYDHEYTRAIRETLQSSSIWEWIKDHFDGLMDKFSSEIHSIKMMFKSFWHAFGQDLESVIQKFMKYTPIKKVIKWIIGWFEPHNDYLQGTESEINPLQNRLVPVLARLLGFYVTPRYGSVSIEIPLKTPVSSLRAAVESVGVPSYMYRMPYQLRSKNDIYTSLMTPYARPAVLEREEVRTFDGLVIPFIPSPCEIVLVQGPQGEKVLVQKQTPEQAKVTVIAQNGEKMIFLVGEGRPIRTPSMSGKTFRSQEMNVTKEEQSVRISMKSVQITLEDGQAEVEVQPRPWSFGQLSGLMGDHNSEIANEVPRNSETEYSQHEGRHSLSRRSARMVLEQHKTQKSCKIPQQ